MKQLRLFLCLSAVFFLAGTAPAADSGGNVIVLKAARLFDGKSKALVTNGVVIVQGDKIIDAGSNLPIPQGAQVIDLGDATLSPGFMDAHTHLTGDFSGNYNDRRLKSLEMNVSDARLFGDPERARDEGSRDFVDVSMRNAIAKGVLPGPRMLVATFGIGATGGHFDDTNGFRDMLFGHEPGSAKALPMDRMRSAKRSDSRSRMARMLSRQLFPAASSQCTTKSTSLN